MSKPSQSQRKSITTTTRDNIQGKLLGTNVKEINVEKFRDAKYTPIPYKLNGKLTDQILKTISNKFSTELIFHLDLSNQQLSNIDALQECKNLVLVNLSKNQIKDLFPLQHCVSITFLNVSGNQIQYLEYLKVMKQLTNLHAEENRIKNIKGLKGLEECENLNSLFLQSLSGKEQNPLCSEEGYRDTVFSYLQQLKRLDSVPKNVKFETGEELEKLGKQNVNIDLNTPGTFFTNQFPKNTPFEKEIQLEGEESLKSSLKECKSQISQLEARIKALMA
ncbi:hypothetical protein ABPG74_003565 [Tetrahymena malaccensis]